MTHMKRSGAIELWKILFWRYYSSKDSEEYLAVHQGFLSHLDTDKRESLQHTSPNNNNV